MYFKEEDEIKLISKVILQNLILELLDAYLQACFRTFSIIHIFKISHAFSEYLHF